MGTRPLQPVLILGAIVLIAGHSFGRAGTDSATSALTVFQRIEQAYRRGEIDYETALLNKVYAIFSPEKLPARFRRKPIKLVKCATPLFLEIRKNWAKLSLEAQRILSRYLQRPTEPDEFEQTQGYGHSYTTGAESYPTEHFRIWYVTTGDDAPPDTDRDGDGVPDWVERCGEIFEEVWAMEIDSLGYREPPPDSLYCPPGDDYGGDAKYDVYVEDLFNVYGYTASEPYGPSEYRRCSYIVVDNNYLEDTFLTKGLDALRVTAAHEFFHAIQFSYDVWEDPYWMEICSTWMEDVAYDQVNDYYNFLPAFFNAPEKSLDTFDGQHEYASCIWAHYLAENYGLDVIRSIWEQCETTGSFSAFDLVLTDGFVEAFKDFTVWNYFTGDRADTGLYYYEGVNYPEVDVFAIHSPPGSGSGQMDHLGSNYIRFVTDQSPGGVKLIFNGIGDPTWGVSVVASRGYGDDYFPQFLVDASGYGELGVRNWSNYSEIVLIPAVLSTSDSAYAYTYKAEYDSTLGDLPPITRSLLLQNRPNPFRISDYPYITCIPFYLSEEADVKIRIFTVSGELVKTIDLGHLPQGYYHENYDKHRNYWDGKNESEELVASGVYFYQIVAGDFVDTRKMVVIR